MTLEGKVVDEAGTAVEGATVLMLADAGPWIEMLTLDRRLVLGERTPTEHPVDQAVRRATSLVTEVDGRFRFDDAPHDHVLVVAAPGYAARLFASPLARMQWNGYGPSRRDGRRQAAPTGSFEVSIPLQRASPAISGVVRDRETGAAASGVRVAVIPPEPLWSSAAWHPMPPSVGVDAQGRFEVMAATEGRYRVLAITGNSPYASMSWDDVVSVRWTGTVIEPVELRVGRGGVLSIDVVSASGAVPAAKCSVLELGPTGDSHEPPRTSTTDQNGRCTVQGLSFGRRHQITVEAEGHPRRGMTEEALSSAEATRTVRVELAPGATLRGRAIYRDGTPAADLGVLVLPRAGSPAEGGLPAGAQRGVTEADGRFSLSGLPLGPAEVRVGRDIFIGAADPHSQDRREIEVEIEQGMAEIRVELDSTPIAGVVVDSEAKPIADARVVLLTSAPSRTGPTRGMAQSDRGGRFVLHAQGDLSATRIKVDAEGYLSSGLIPVRDPAEALRVALVRSAWVAGRVVIDSARATPIAGFVRAVDVAPDDTFGDPWSGNGQVELDGAFTLEVRPGSTTIEAQVTGYLPSARQTFELEAGARREGVILRVSEGAVVSGSLLDAEGAALSGARVHLRLDDSIDPSVFVADAFSDGEGGFRLVNVPPGEHVVSALHPQRSAPIEATVQVGPGRSPEPVRLRFGATGRVSGRVTRNGAPAAGFAVYLTREGDLQSGGQAMADQEGRFEVHANAGRYQLFAIDVQQLIRQMPGASYSLSELPPHARPVDVRVGETTTVDLALDGPKGVHLTGAVDGLPPGFAFFLFLLPEGASLAEGAAPATPPATMDMSGQFNLFDVPAGTYTLTILDPTAAGASGEMGVIHEQTVVVGEEDARLKIQIKRP